MALAPASGVDSSAPEHHGSAPAHVAIVGGGIAGLALAFGLTHRTTGAPLRVTVLEAAPRAGGNLRSEHVDGYLLEWGPNGFLDNVPATLALVRELGLEPRLLPSSDAARRRFLYRKGRLHRLPEGPVSFFASPLLSWRGRLRVACEPVARSRPDREETIHEFAARRIGREAADVLVDSMVSGVFGGDARELSLRACFPKMYDMETEHGGLVRAMLARRASRPRGAPMGSPLGRLTSFTDGVEELVRALVGSLGGAVRTNCRVDAIEPHDGAEPGARWRLRIRGASPVLADHVVLSAGAGTSSCIVQHAAPSLAKALQEIGSAPMVVVCLGYESAASDHPLNGFGFLVPRSERMRILGALWDSSIYPGRAPEGRALIRVMLGGATDLEAVHLHDEALVEEARGGLRTAMGLRAEPVFRAVIRHPVGIPQYTRGHLGRLARIDEALARHPGLWVTGNSFRGVSINACVAEAEATAARLVAARG